ncbi:MAG: hypothetical protein ACRDNF_16795 [Streptosporangiaceae bacterium]
MITGGVQPDDHPADAEAAGVPPDRVQPRRISLVRGEQLAAQNPGLVLHGEQVGVEQLPVHRGQGGFGQPGYIGDRARMAVGGGQQLRLGGERRALPGQRGTAAHAVRDVHHDRA